MRKLPNAVLFLFVTAAFLLALTPLRSQTLRTETSSAAPAKNLVIFLMDGYRWKELYGGADSGILFNRRFNHVDSAWTVKKYWASDAASRRHRLMPFVWDSIAVRGMLLGNRDWGNKVNVTNHFWYSYPGRSEAFTGFADSLVGSQGSPDNPFTNVLEFIDNQSAFHGKVVTFASWDVVAKVLNRDRNKMPVNIYGEDVSGPLTPFQKEANNWQHLLPDVFGKGERLDAGTYAMAKAYMQANHPRVVYIDLGDPDDFAHARDYNSYLDAAHAADAMMRDIWTLIQGDPFYRGNTAMLILADHGRGFGNGWTSHGIHYEHSNEVFFMGIGSGIPALGEVRSAGQAWESQFAQTAAHLLGLRFTAEHPVAEELPLR